MSSKQMLNTPLFELFNVDWADVKHKFNVYKT